MRRIVRGPQCVACNADRVLAGRSLHRESRFERSRRDAPVRQRVAAAQLRLSIEQYCGARNAERDEPVREIRVGDKGLATAHHRAQLCALQAQERMNGSAARSRTMMQVRGAVVRSSRRARSVTSCSSSRGEKSLCAAATSSSASRSRAPVRRESVPNARQPASKSARRRRGVMVCPSSERLLDGHQTTPAPARRMSTTSASSSPTA